MTAIPLWATTCLSAGEMCSVARGVRTRPRNLWRRRRVRSSPFRASFLPVHFLGSQCPSSHMASGHGSFASGPPPSPSRQALSAASASAANASRLAAPRRLPRRGAAARPRSMVPRLGGAAAPRPSVSSGRGDGDGPAAAGGTGRGAG